MTLRVSDAAYEINYQDFFPFVPFGPHHVSGLSMKFKVDRMTNGLEGGRFDIHVLRSGGPSYAHALK